MKYSKTVRANLTTAKSGNEERSDRNAIESGHWYMLEIVRAYTRENRSLYALDGSRMINGSMRIVSTQKMYVENVYKSGHSLRLVCIGTDRYGRRANGTYVYYFDPETIHNAETFVLSFTRL